MICEQLTEYSSSATGSQYGRPFTAFHVGVSLKHRLQALVNIVPDLGIEPKIT